MNDDGVVNAKKLFWYLVVSLGMVMVLVLFVGEAYHGLV